MSHLSVKKAYKNIIPEINYKSCVSYGKYVDICPINAINKYREGNEVHIEINIE